MSWYSTIVDSFKALGRPVDMSVASKRLDRYLGETRTKRYRPTTASQPAWAGTNGWGAFSLGLVDEMRKDWQVKQAFGFKTAPLFTAKFKVAAGSPAQQKFAEEQLHRYWETSLSIGLECMAYGFMGPEPLYKEERGMWRFDRLKTLHPRDVRPWTKNGKLAFVKLKSSGGNVVADIASHGPEEAVNLPGATRNVPAKGAWFTYEAKYHQWYGMALCQPAWWPWRLKTMPDGAMENIFKAFYKHSFLGAIVRHPNSTYTDANGQQTAAQDYARQMGEQMKAGANIAVPGTRDEKGEYEWLFEKYGGEIVADFTGLIAYPDWLDKLIVRGMGIPDEILTHDGNTGGFSRSNIAFLAFLILEEEILKHHLEQVVEQIVQPLLRFNFGDKAWCKVVAEPLLPDPTQQPPGGGMPGAPGQMPQAGAAPAPPAGTGAPAMPGGGGGAPVPVQMSHDEPVNRDPKLDAIETSSLAAGAAFYDKLKEELIRRTAEKKG